MYKACELCTRINWILSANIFSDSACLLIHLLFVQYLLIQLMNNVTKNNEIVQIAKYFLYKGCISETIRYSHKKKRSRFIFIGEKDQDVNVNSQQSTNL